MSIQTKLKQWCHKQIAEADEESGPIVRFALVHLNLANKSAPVVEVKVTKKTDPQTVAVKVCQAANDDASGVGGIQKYALLAYAETNAEKSSARFTFRVTVDNDEDGESFGSDSEPATKGGLIAQQMRHNEALMRVSTMSTGEVIRQLQATIERQYDRIERLETRHMESIELVEELQNHKHTREMQALEFAAKETRNEQLMEKLNLIAPILVNKIVGKKVLPEAFNPISEGMKALMESLSPVQIEQLQKIMSPEQLMSMLSLYESFRPKELPASANGAS